MVIKHSLSMPRSMMGLFAFSGSCMLRTMIPPPQITTLPSNEHVTMVSGGTAHTSETSASWAETSRCVCAMGRSEIASSVSFHAYNSLASVAAYSRRSLCSDVANIDAMSGLLTSANCLSSIPFPAATIAVSHRTSTREAQDLGSSPWLKSRMKPSLAATSKRISSESKAKAVTAPLSGGQPQKVDTPRPDPARNIRISLDSSATATRFFEEQVVIATKL
eukprot:1365578-Rhodomonas_salina.2